MYAIDGRRFLNLQTIVIPARERKRGIATKIVEISEEIAREDGYCGSCISQMLAFAKNTRSLDHLLRTMVSMSCAFVSVMDIVHAFHFV